MRILQSLAGAEHGGAETAFVDTCIAMKEAGHDIEVVTRSNPIRVPRLKNAGIKVHTLPFGGVLDFYTPWKIKRIARTFNPDIVQCWMSRASAKTPSSSSYLKVCRLGGYYKLKYFKTADYFMTITPDIKRYLMDHGIAGDRIRHINNFAETEITKEKVDRTSLNTPHEGTLLLSLGRLHDSKAFDILMKALVDLPDVYLWIAGEGPDRHALEYLRDNLGLQKRVMFLGWREDRAALFNACDICVFPSRYEPFGTVFVQAWAQKTPLITSLADGPRQFVRDQEDGLTFPVDDVSALNAAIKSLKEDKMLQEKLVKNGYERYLNEFSKEKTLQAYSDYFEEILKRKKV